MSQVIETLNSHIEGGITANVSVSGKNGIAEQTAKYDKLRQNAQR